VQRDVVHHPCDDQRPVGDPRELGGLSGDVPDDVCRGHRRWDEVLQVRDVESLEHLGAQLVT
jgi:hypothetical protein